MRKRKLTKSDVASMVKSYLERHQPREYRIEIDRKGVSIDAQGWWSVPVRASVENVPSYDVSARCAEAAVDLHEAEGLNVLFM